MKTLKDYQQSSIGQYPLTLKDTNVIRYKEDQLSDLLQTLQRIETKIDVLLMQRGK